MINLEDVLEAHRGEGTLYTAHEFQGMRVLVSVATMKNGTKWLHVSFSRPHEIPSWEDFKLVKNQFVGCEKVAVMVLPKNSEYINVHPTCMHLFSPLGFAVGVPNLFDIVSEAAPQ